MHHILRPSHTTHKTTVTVASKVVVCMEDNWIFCSSVCTGRWPLQSPLHLWFSISLQTKPSLLGYWLGCFSGNCKSKHFNGLLQYLRSCVTFWQEKTILSKMFSKYNGTSLDEQRDTMYRFISMISYTKEWKTNTICNIFHGFEMKNSPENLMSRILHLIIVNKCTYYLIPFIFWCVVIFGPFSHVPRLGCLCETIDSLNRTFGADML